MITGKDCIVIGEVTKTHGLQGNVVITSDTDFLEEFIDEPVFLLLDGAPVPFFIADNGLSVRNHKSYIVKFDYVDTKEQAERLAGAAVMIEKSLLQDEGEEEWAEEEDIYRLDGFTVEEQETGEHGEVIDVADYSGNVVLTLQIFGKEILLPVSEEYIKEVNAEEKKLLVSIPQELIDLY